MVLDGRKKVAAKNNHLSLGAQSWRDHLSCSPKVCRTKCQENVEFCFRMRNINRILLGLRRSPNPREILAVWCLVNLEARWDEGSDQERKREALSWKEWFGWIPNCDSTKHKGRDLETIASKELLWIIFSIILNFRLSLIIATRGRAHHLLKQGAKLKKTRAIPRIHDVDLSILNASQLENDINLNNIADLLAPEQKKVEEYEEEKYE